MVCQQRRSLRFAGAMMLGPIAMTMLLFTALNAGQSSGATPGVGDGGANQLQTYPEPYFDPAAPTNFTAQLGTDAFLECKIRHLNMYPVSWVRQRDQLLLAVDHNTFITDNRFRAFRDGVNGICSLRVKNVQARDAGRYECQVGTKPKMSLFVQLIVQSPKIIIEGEMERFVTEGSTVNFTCTILQTLTSPIHVIWYRDDHPLSTLNGGGQQQGIYRVNPEKTIASLNITNTQVNHAGKYRCSLFNLDSASVKLHVLTGVQLDAIRRPAAAVWAPLLLLGLAFLVLIVFSIIYLLSKRVSI